MNSTKQPGPLEVRLSDQLGPVAERTYTRAQLLAAIEAERHACSIAVWMTLHDALAEDADDKGLDGWMREAEQRVKNRSANDPDVAAMVVSERTKAFQDAARWVDEEMGHAIQDGWSVEAVQALMATRDMLKAHADMRATTA
jgi:hypothetical protein